MRENPSAPASALDGTTLTPTGEEEEKTSWAVRPFLFLVLRADKLDDAPARFALPPEGELVVQRTTAGRRFRVDGQRISVSVDDIYMSRDPVRFTCRRGRWKVEETPGRNESSSPSPLRVNGEARSEALLKDEDLLQIGHTFFRFRDSLRAPADTPPVLDGAELNVPDPALVTLLPELERTFQERAASARSKGPWLIQGETGTGKEVLTKALSRLSGRKAEPVTVNCGAIAKELLEGELFGVVKGAFTGAGEGRIGFIRQAHKGFLMLDEIGDLPLSAQVALLRVLENHEVTPVGASTPVKVDIRVVAATHKDLRGMVAQKTFRQDLLARLDCHSLVLPPLRHRIEDLGFFVRAILHELGRSGDPPTLAGKAALTLLRYGWPHNARELHHWLRRAVDLSSYQGHRKIDVDHFSEQMRCFAEGEEAAKRQKIVGALRRHKGNQTRAAEELGWYRNQLLRWLKRYGIDARLFKEGRSLPAP